jgi:hypothetical protein
MGCLVRIHGRQCHNNKSIIGFLSRYISELANVAAAHRTSRSYYQVSENDLQIFAAYEMNDVGTVGSRP